MWSAPSPAEAGERARHCAALALGGVLLARLEVVREELLGPKLDLAHALARDAPALADLLEGARLILLEPVVDDVPAQLTHALADPAERLAHLAVRLDREERVLRARAVVLDPLEMGGLVLVVDRAVEREVGLGHRAALRSDAAPRLLEVLADVGADPPDGVRGEAGAGVRVELLGRAHQADVPLLDHVVEADGPAPLLAGDGHDEGEVVAHEALPRVHVTAAGLDGEGVLVLAGEGRGLADGIEVGSEILEFPAAAASR